MHPVFNPVDVPWYSEAFTLLHSGLLIFFLHWEHLLLAILALYPMKKIQTAALLWLFFFVTGAYGANYIDPSTHLLAAPVMLAALSVYALIKKELSSDPVLLGVAALASGLSWGVLFYAQTSLNSLALVSLPIHVSIIAVPALIGVLSSIALRFYAKSRPVLTNWLASKLPLFSLIAALAEGLRWFLD